MTAGSTAAAVTAKIPSSSRGGWPGCSGRAGRAAAPAWPTAAPPWPAERPSTVPQSPQNFESGAFAAPQDGQPMASLAPHSLQNLRPDSLTVPQLEQSTLSTLR